MRNIKLITSFCLIMLTTTAFSIEKDECPELTEGTYQCSEKSFINITKNPNHGGYSITGSYKGNITSFRDISNFSKYNPTYTSSKWDGKRNIGVRQAYCQDGVMLLTYHAFNDVPDDQHIDILDTLLNNPEEIEKSSGTMKSKKLFTSANLYIEEESESRYIDGEKHSSRKDIKECYLVN